MLSSDQFPLTNFHPVGETDSEHAFCYLLERLHPLWRHGSPSVEGRARVVREVANTLASLGPSNFLYSDGEYLYAFSHWRPRADRSPPRSPGLYWLCLTCQGDMEAEGISVLSHQAPEEQKIVMAASVPLTDGPWKPMEEGSLLILSNGTPVSLEGGRNMSAVAFRSPISVDCGLEG